MRKLLTKAEEVMELCFEGNNWQEMLEFVGVESFHLSLGSLFVKTRNGNLTKVNSGDSIVKLNSGQFEVFSEEEIEFFEVVETEDELNQGD